MTLANYRAQRRDTIAHLRRELNAALARRDAQAYGTQASETAQAEVDAVRIELRRLGVQA